jgi:hypothetical protein
MTVVPISSTNSKIAIAGFALVAAGGLISMCGIGLTGTAMVNAIRRWMKAQQEPPAAIVRRKIAQAKAATTAGVGAWQDGMATSAPSR